MRTACTRERHGNVSGNTRNLPGRVRRAVPALTWLVCGVALASTVEAQATSGRDRVERAARTLTPWVALADVGFDSNVFQRHEQEAPQPDWTATLRSGLDFRTPAGPFDVSARGGGGAAYYRDYAQARSVDLDWAAQLGLPLHRVKPYLAIAGLRTREPHDLEIDLRPRRVAQRVRAGVEFRLGARTSLDAHLARSSISFDATEAWLGTARAEMLTRDTRALAIAARYALTPLTRLVFQTERSEDDFRLAPERDARSVLLLPGIEFQPLALVSGSAYLGYRRISFMRSSGEQMAGLTGSVDLEYVLAGRTGLGVLFERDVRYSYRLTHPTYTLRSFGGSIRQPIGGAWQAIYRAARHRLQYLAEPGAGGLPVSVEAHRGTPDAEVVWSHGGTLEYRVDRTTRLGAQIEYRTRVSGIAPWRDYSRMRVGTFVRHDF